ncbi:MAG: hypothetical protein V4510_01175 [bacterium]
MQRKTRILILCVAGLLVASAAVTIAVVARGPTDSGCRGDPATDPAGCPSHERLRRYCAEHPRDAKCHPSDASRPQRGTP